MKTNSYAIVVVFTILIGLIIMPAIPVLRKTHGQTNGTSVIPNAESVFKSQSMKFTSSLAAHAIIMVLIPNEAHESLKDESHKLITDHNPYFIPTNLVIPQGTAISFINADAPWDTPNPHTINIKDKHGELVYSTEVLQYTNSSKPKILDVGKYTMIDSENEFMKGTITVITDQESISSISSSNGSNSLIVGGF